MLPDSLYVNDEDELCWDCHAYAPVDDTELLHICWLAEEKLSSAKACEYYYYLYASKKEPPSLEAYSWHTPCQQRALALAKVKGIEL